MTTLTLTPNAATGSHQLQIVSTYTVTRIQRTDANGSYDVRTLPGFLPAAPGTTTLDDYEPGNGLSTYTVTTSGDTIQGTATLPLGAPWLGVPVTPQFSARLQSVMSYGAALDSRSTVLEPEGSPFPLVISRATSSRRGSMELWAGDYPAALALMRVCGRPGVKFLRQADHAGMDMFFHAPTAELTTLKTEGKASVFGVRVQYIEVPRPGAPLSGALGWTWGALKNSYATWGDVFNAFATWGDVRTNRPTP